MKPTWSGVYGTDCRERQREADGRTAFYTKDTPGKHAEIAFWLRQWACAATSGQSNVTALPARRTHDRGALVTYPRFNAILASFRANPDEPEHHYHGLTGTPKARI
jgi:hypothetical protein